MPDTEEKTVSKQKDEERVRTLDKWFATACEAEKSFYEQAVEDEKFYMGDQWADEDKQALQKDNKPALTYNYIFSLVNLINGYHRQNKMDIKVHNIRGGSREVAEIFGKLIKHIKQTKNGDWEISYAHLYGLITGKAYLMLDIDYEEDILNGNLFLEYVHHSDVRVDPFGNRYDLSDRDYFFRSVWMPKDRIERLYPGKLEDGDFQVSANDRLSVLGMETFNYKDAAEYQDQSDDDIDTYRYRVKEAWWKEYVEHKCLVNIQTGKVHNVSELHKEQIKRIIINNPQFRGVRRVKTEIHRSRYVGLKELLHDEKPLGGMKNFPLVGFFPYFMRNTCQGIVTQLKDPQREHNKRLSQALYHLNASANSGFTADADAVDDWDDFVEKVTNVGYVKKIKKGARFEKDHPTELSQGHVVLAQNGEVAIKKISGVNSDLLGQDQAETVSGVAIARRQAQGLMTTEIVHDNLRLSLKILGDRKIEAIQKSGAYSREEIIRLVVDGEEDQIEINKKLQGIEKVQNDLSVGTYETTVNVSIQTPTARMANYLSLIEAMKLGAPIPPDVLVQASDWPEKDKILKRMQEQMQQQAAMAKVELEEKQKDRDLEIMKIQEKTQGDMLKDAQKTHLDLLTEKEENKSGSGKNNKNN